MARIPLRSAVILVLLLAAIVMTALSASLFTRIDQIVHGDLYKYGLKFSDEWAGEYWMFSRLMLSVLGLAIGATAVSILLVLTNTRTREISLFAKARNQPKIHSTELIGFLQLLIGTLALAISVYYNSSILAFIGLGLVFWGALLFYAHPEKYIKKTLLDKTAQPTLESLDQIMEELGCKGHGIYLPPGYLTDFESSKVYISTREDVRMPSPEQTQILEKRTSLKDPGGILITPPGAELTKLFEETLGTSFARVDLKYVVQNLPRLLIEELEAAQNLEIRAKDSTVHVKIENSIYKGICTETGKLPNITSSLGCPLCSAIACTLAKATGKPVTIEKEHTSNDGSSTDIEYLLLEGTSQ